MGAKARGHEDGVGWLEAFLILTLDAAQWVTVTLHMLYPQYVPQFLSAFNREGKIRTASRSLIPVNQSLPLTSLTILAQLLSKIFREYCPLIYRWRSYNQTPLMW